jgi:protein transport protein SEC24
MLDNEEMSIFWVGLAASPQQIQDLFGVDDIQHLTTNLVILRLISFDSFANF